MKRDAVLNLRLPSAVKEALDRAARDQMRTRSSMAAWALAEWATDRGYLPKHPAASPRNRKGQA